MASQSHITPHFLLFPFMAQGHMIPMIDLAKLLARRGAIITIVTTPLNSARFHSVLTRAIRSGLQIHIVELQFPSNKETGLPEGCENVDLLPSLASFSQFFRAVSLLYDPSEKLFEQLTPRPNCIISDMCIPWTFQLAQKFHVPRLVFYSLSCFFLLCLRILITNVDAVKSIPDSKFVALPDLPFPVEFRRSQLYKSTDAYMTQITSAMFEADRQSYGVVLNVFEEMDPEHVTEYIKGREAPEKVWCVGPLSLSNDNELDKVERGDKASVDGHECTKWLDGQNPSSVVYVSLGSLCNLDTSQIIELGLGLEASNRPFIWVIRKANLTEDLVKWLEEYDFEEKIQGHGIVIRGWAPQVLILSHSAIGCFLTHCGWNSSVEGISAGVPMITWPLFGDQVYNYKLIVEILRVGVSVGEGTDMHWEEEDVGRVVVKREKVKEAIEMVMDGDDREEMRERCKVIGEKAKKAVAEGGSSHRNLSRLIEDITAHAFAHGGSFENGRC
ncbi:UDP-glycosyltransferase 73C6-like isoform X2 [Benincasa hispida]|uniref:UDP-glycosyltransferase 73C6-like isoform X1 n=1 Tax=Benincasa hispida TaxID=102211 RepID=UPI0018FFBF8E|nr:UDP-glycosyltransferase 73C6-like isoform X1 [Benincasa hispida]XP_038903825.1 UDP-glycosyltransferase 73C6-like isoform X2 [Benincasa hispida]